MLDFATSMDNKRGGGGGVDNSNAKKCKDPSNHHYPHTNIQLYTGRMLFLSSNQQCQSAYGNCLSRKFG